MEIVCDLISAEEFVPVDRSGEEGLEQDLGEIGGGKQTTNGESSLS